MGKLVKFCSSCDENFADRFAFCPTCGATLQAFEMKPVDAQVDSAEAIPESIETAQVVEAASEPEFVAPAIIDERVIEQPIETAQIDEEEIEEPVEKIPATISIPAATATSVFATQAMHADEPRAMKVTPEALDSGYYITVIDEKNGNQRNWLLLGSAVFCVVLALSATVYSLFDKDMGIAAIDDEMFRAVLVEDMPTTVEEEVQKEKEDKGGGGGGGGREEKEEVSQGDRADQTDKPQRAPDAKVPRLTDPLQLPPASTEGDRKFPKNFDRYGDPNSKFAGLSNGTGSGGGQGSGVGTGQGSGRGTGTGSGTGSGSGGGNGDGDGDGDGPGGNGGPPPAAVKAVTQNYKILAKPQAKYTDAARTNQVSGSVRLKVTLLSSGQVGSITPVTRLPHGLTEQAIAAARLIRFEPKKINGVAQSIVVTIDYGFNIY